MIRDYKFRPDRYRFSRSNITYGDLVEVNTSANENREGVLPPTPVLRCCIPHRFSTTTLILTHARARAHTHTHTHTHTHIHIYTHARTHARTHYRIRTFRVRRMIACAPFREISQKLI